MTDYYIDMNATGTGSGTSPTDAYTGVIAAFSANPWSQNNARVWIKRDHIESHQSMYLGGRNDFKQWQRFGLISGWPNSGDPMYSERPQAGIDAGWDSVHASGTQAASLGYDFPTISTIGNRIYIRAVNAINLCLSNTSGQLIIDSDLFTEPAIPSVYTDNILMLGNGQNGAMPTISSLGLSKCNHGKIIMVASSSDTDTGGIIQSGGYAFIRHLIVHSLSIAQSMIYGDKPYAFIGHLQIDTSSIGYFTATNITGDIQDETEIGAAWTLYIEKISGFKPYNGDMSNNNLTSYFTTRVDDYYGEGPLMSIGLGFVSRVASISEAQHNGKPTIYHSVGSRDNLRGLRNLNYIRLPQTGKYFDVVSGQGITIAQPIYVDSLGGSIDNPMMRVELLAHGCSAQYAENANVSAGSYDNWTGSLISGGSAYLLTATWTPAETGTVKFNFYMGMWVNPVSGTFLPSYELFGEPYQVS